MAIDLSALSFSTTKATALANLILVNPQKNVGIQPQNSPVKAGLPTPTNQAPSFLFNYEGEQSVTLQSDVGDHYIEDNTAINDQVALKPEVISTHGFVGELTDILPEILGPAKFLNDKLTGISAYAPGLSRTATNAINKAAQVYSVASNLAGGAVSAWNTLTGSGPVQTKQQLAFTQFYGYWQQRTLFTVQTPWAVFNNMVILSMRAVQDEDTKVITDFDITFKKLRFATTETLSSRQAQGRLNQQSQSKVNNGTSTPLQAAQSFIDSSILSTLRG